MNIFKLTHLSMFQNRSDPVLNTNQTNNTPDNVFF